MFSVRFLFLLPVRKGPNDLALWFSVFVHPFTLSHLLPLALLFTVLLAKCFFPFPLGLDSH